jgi:hypothetical protein
MLSNQPELKLKLTTINCYVACAHIPGRAEINYSFTRSVLFNNDTGDLFHEHCREVVRFLDSCPLQQTFIIYVNGIILIDFSFKNYLLLTATFQRSEPCKA